MDSEYKNDLKYFITYIREKNLNYKEIEEQFDLSDKETIVKGLLELLKDEIDNFSYNQSKSIGYLIDLLDLIPYLANNNKSLKKYSITEFENTHRKIKYLIHSRPEVMNKKQNTNYSLLKKTLLKLEDTELKFYSKMPTDYDFSKEEFISYIIFKSKKIDFYEMALKKYPYIINSKDKNNVPLINRVLDKYLESLDKYLDNINLGPIDDLLYYNKIFKSMINNPKLYFPYEEKREMLKKIKNYVEDKKYDSNKLNEKLTYFTNNLFFIINDDEHELDEETFNYEYDISSNFNASQILEAKKILILNKNLEPTKKDGKIYTFDGKGAFELDDGVSITNEDGIYKLGVHIANPAFYIPENSPIMNEARRRTRTLYSKDLIVPMIPLLLSKDLMSLNANDTKNAMSFYFEIDNVSGRLIKYEIKNENIRVFENKTYDDFDATIGDESRTDEYHDTLVNLLKVSNLLKNNFKETEDYKALHSDDYLAVSTSVIATVMLYANMKLAEYASQKDLPFIYRCHQIKEEDIREINELKERIQLGANTEITDYLEQLKKVYPSAFYTTKNVGHMGLGVNYYSHSTSPLRRFPDIVNLGAISTFDLHEVKNKDQKERYKDYLEQVSEEINSKRKSLDEYESEYAKRLKKSL